MKIQCIPVLNYNLDGASSCILILDELHILLGKLKILIELLFTIPP